ncbi:MAG: Gfo/Idh/MocA family oxidoreductase [Ruminococcaceae bacterium]|nr:Gfo/Idh/MocA family oxidoreductase [Oscillospiraceae bacterium]
MKRVKIAQIGTSKNSHGNQIWKSLNKQSDIFEVVGYALPENEREKFPDQMKAFEGYREMTVEEILSAPEIEAVAVETEEIYLTKYALMVAKAGKHLHMEKPGGLELTDFEELIDILRVKALTFSTGYMYRFNPKIREALEKIKRGELGKIYSVEAHMDCKHTPNIREWLEAFPGGMLFFLGCHLIDLIYQIQGEPEEIIPLSCSTGIGDIHTDDYGMVVFKYRDGVSFAKTCDNECGGFMRRQLVICGEKGTIEIKPLEVGVDGGQYTVSSECFDDSGKHWSEPWATSKSEIHDRYDGMLRNFAELVRGKENPYSYDYELNLYKLVLKSCGKEV